MDELRRKDVIARRLALTLSICCLTTSGSAAELNGKRPSATSIRQLLAQGWESTSPSSTAESSSAEMDSSVQRWPVAIRPETPVSESKREAPAIRSASAKPAASSVTPSKPTDEQTRASSLSELIRRGSGSRPTLEQRAQATSRGTEPQPLTFPPLPILPEPEANAVERDASSVEEEVAGEQDRLASSDTLADFLRENRNSVAIPNRQIPSSAVANDIEQRQQDAFVAPKRKSLPQANELLSRESSDHVAVQSAPEMIAEPPVRERQDVASQRVSPESIVGKTIPSKPVASTPVASTPVASTPVASAPVASAPVASAPVASKPIASAPAKRITSRVPTLATVPARLVPVLDKLPDSVPGESVLSETDGVPAPLASAKAASSDPAITSLATVPPSPVLTLPGADDVLEDESSATARNPAAMPMTSELSRLDEQLGSDDNDFAIFPIPSLENDRGLAPPMALPSLAPSVTLHTTRLLELAQHSILKSQKSLQRGATRTARKDAIEALQAIVSMRDAQEGGNFHSQELDHAFDAIRESKDFCGEFGNIDSAALRRMVDVHETAVLKHRELNTISALEATEAYLDFAREQLALATGGVREGSQALVLMGQIESQIAKPGDTHATSVAVAVQHAAVEADPYYAVGYRVLGSTLLDLGLVEEAANCLVTSVRLQPTRLGYERLLDVARRLGDVDTARICMTALEDPRMEEGNLVHNLTPQDFAATYRPAPRLIETSRSSSKSDAVKAQAEPAARISFGSLFPFGRR